MTRPDSSDADGSDTDAEAGRVFKPLKYTKTGPRSVEIDSSGPHRDQTQEHREPTEGDKTIIDAIIDDHAQDVGNVTPIPSVESAVSEPHVRVRVNVLAVTNRLRKEGHWNEELKLELFKTARKSMPDSDQDARQQWVYGELDRMYPPAESSASMRKLPPTSESGQSAATDSGAIQGLSDLPADWPTLTANASLAAEVGWVQANRLRIVEERPGAATRVRLDMALSPAPSWAALGWLETSIRSYAKYVDVVARASTGAEEEGAVMKRERRSIEEMKALLAEMEEAAGVCPSCGKPF